jgi:ankyrin repeat protein
VRRRMARNAHVTISQMIKDRADPSPLIGTWFMPPELVAVAEGDVAGLRRLVAQGCPWMEAAGRGSQWDVNELTPGGDTPLHMAAINGPVNGRVEMVKTLVQELGVDIELKSARGSTALHAAADMGLAEMVTVLLQLGADKEATKGGGTPLVEAAVGGYLETVKVLVEAGAHLEARCPGGSTALHFAACAGKAEIIRVLVEAGAELEAQAAHGWTPLHYAALMGVADAVRQSWTGAGRAGG